VRADPSAGGPAYDSLIVMSMLEGEYAARLGGRARPRPASESG
jgi:hypothetical protein